MLGIILMAGLIVYAACPIKELVALFIVLVSTLVLAVKLFERLEVK